MALKKEKTLTTGVTGEYWRIISSQAQYPSQVSATVGLYLNKEARKEGKTPLMIETYELTLDGEATRESMYAGLKSLKIDQITTDADGIESWGAVPGFFSDAIDD